MSESEVRIQFNEEQRNKAKIKSSAWAVVAATP